MKYVSKKNAVTILALVFIAVVVVLLHFVLTPFIAELITGCIVGWFLGVKSYSLAEYILRDYKN